MGDSFKPRPICFPAVKQELIVDQEDEKNTSLIELGVRKTLAVSISQGSEEQ
jgi:hypothetical protein